VTGIGRRSCSDGLCATVLLNREPSALISLRRTPQPSPV
jgi:hypothetical protein